jgi:thioredoxin 1
MKTITAEEFKTAVESNTQVIIQFSANWCGPCKRMTPLLDKFAEGKDSISVYKVDVGESSELAKEYDVKSIPKLIVFKNGEKYKEAIGLVPTEKLENLIK